MSQQLPVFKTWVPVWLIRFTIFIVIVPGLLLFGLSTASGPGAAGYYGIEPSDVQFTMIAFYAAVAGFFALERRFFIFIASREYFLICLIMQIITSYICMHTSNLYILLIFRFLQGMCNCMSTSICITLIFGSLHTERAREIGYSIFYGMLLCITPISTIITAPILDAFDYNVLYKFIIFAFLPGAILLLVIMNNVRLNRKMPLYQLDIPSFIIYSAFLCLIGYILIYGQQYYWLEEPKIRWGFIAALLLLTLNILRQLHLRRPDLSLEVFKYRNFMVGAVMIFLLYIARGALGITSTYFSGVLGMDPIHIGWLMLTNIGGIVLGVLVSSRLVIMKRPMRLTWIYGFALLLIFHIWMWFLFSSAANADTFIVPLLIQGIGTGMLMTPIIVFMISSVPANLANSASATGVFFRFTGFCSSIAVVNYFQLKQKNDHINRFQEHISTLDGTVADRLAIYARGLSAKGMLPDQAAKAARGLLNRSVDTQAALRAMMDYYLFISIMIAAVILFIALIPYINRTKINLKSKQPAAVGY
jgi:DHA2 family multidrug resistance protein